MEIEDVAKSWIEMWGYEVNDPKREAFAWVDDFEFDAVYEKPDVALDLVIEILKQNSSSRILEVLAAGPLEQVLANHGESIIERVETQAKNSPKFAHLLGGVWKNAMSEHVWQRVQKVWNRAGWDGNP